MIDFVQRTVRFVGAAVDLTAFALELARLRLRELEERLSERDYETPRRRCDCAPDEDCGCSPPWETI